MMLAWLLVACRSDESQPAGKVEVVADAVAACESNGNPHACYEAALADPEYEFVDNYLNKACLGGVKASCAMYLDVSTRRGHRLGRITASAEGCRAGDAELCDALLAISTEQGPERKAWAESFITEVQANR